MPGPDTTGKPVPTTDFSEYDVGAISAGDPPEPVFDPNERTLSVIIVAPPNNGAPIFVGFDENVGSSKGLTLSPGQNLPLGHDASENNIFVATDSGTQAYEYAALR